MRTSLITAALLIIPLTVPTPSFAEYKPRPVDPNVAQGDDGCASFAGLFIAHLENTDPDQMAAWKYECEHHPLQRTCESTERFIEETRPEHPLHCAGAGR